MRVQRVAAGVGLLLAFVACSPGSDPSATTSSGSGGGFQLSGGGGAGGIDDGCDGIYETANERPLHLYVMVDASSSMAGSKWAAARAGLDAFVSDSGSAGVDVGLSFFPRPPDGVPACDQPAYKEPVVPFALLPQNAAALLAAMDARTPDGFTSPVYPALGGALLKAIDVSLMYPNDATAVLLVTDGKPQGPAPTCSGVNPEDPTAIGSLVGAALALDPSIATFVVALPGADATVNNQIAAAGGTGQAIFVGTTNTAQKFAEALAKVKGQALSCRYELPEGVTAGTVPLAQINVSITPSGGTDTWVPQVQDCSQAGWKFDDPNMPTAIILCDETCALIENDSAASIAIVLGCPTVK